MRNFVGPQGEASARAGGEERERVDVGDALICQDHLANRSGVPEQAYHGAVASSPDRLLLLSSQGPPRRCCLFHDRLLCRTCSRGPGRCGLVSLSDECMRLLVK